MLNWQLLSVGLIVFCAASYLIHAAWRAWRGGKAGCGGSSCACSGKSEPTQARGFIPLKELTLRRRNP